MSDHASDTAVSLSAAVNGSRYDLLAVMRRKLAGKLDAGEIAGNCLCAAHRELLELHRLVRLEEGS